MSYIAVKLKIGRSGRNSAEAGEKIGGLAGNKSKPAASGNTFGAQIARFKPKAAALGTRRRSRKRPQPTRVTTHIIYEGVLSGRQQSTATGKEPEILVPKLPFASFPP